MNLVRFLNTEAEALVGTRRFQRLLHPVAAALLKYETLGATALRRLLRETETAAA